MRVIAALLPLVLITAAEIQGQVAGDSVRLRVQPASIWNHGRFASFDGQRLTVTEVEINRDYAVQTVTRLEVRRRKKAVAEVLGATVGVALGVALANLVRPDNRRPLFGSDGANVAVGAGFGLVAGLISVKVKPWRWERVRLKPAT